MKAASETDDKVPMKAAKPETEDVAVATARVDNLVQAKEAAPTTEQKSWRDGKWRKDGIWLLDTYACQTLFVVCLVLVLFTVDVVAILSLPDSVNDGVNAMLLTIFILYSIEFLINCICKDEYPFGFFFWMDFIGTFSIIADISWLASGWLEFGSNGTTLRASRAARVGSKAGRLTRVLKVVRLMKIVMTKYFNPNQFEKESLASSGGAPSAIGQTLAEAISHQVAALVMITVLVIPLLQVEELDQAPVAYVQMFTDQLELISTGSQEASTLDPMVNGFYDFLDGGSFQPLTLIIGHDPVLVDQKWADEPGRASNKVEYDGDDVYVGDRYYGNVVATFDISSKNEEEAMWAIIFVNFVILELVLFSSLLNGRTNTLVVRPLERIFDLIQLNASHIMGQLDLDLATSELSSMEKAVGKMTNIMSKVGKKGEKKAVADVMNDDNVDDATKAWLLDMDGEVYDNDDEVLHESKGRKSTRKVAVATREHHTRSNGVEIFYSHEEYKGLMKIMAERGENVEDLKDIDISVVQKWEFDVYSLKVNQLYLCVFIMFEDLGLLEAGLIGPDEFWLFLAAVQKNYHENMYHNFHHAIDVTQTLYRMISLLDVRLQFSVTEKMALMVGALAHDMDHPGVTNNFLIASRDELAMTYNDASVLESRHVACLYGLLKQTTDADVFKNIVDDKTWREIRKIIIGCVLHTDMTHHFAMVSQVDLFYELHSEQLARGDPFSSFCKAEDRQFLFNMLLHSSDISNPVKPLNVYEKWADCVLGEFFMQGDLEKSKNMPVSPMMDRNTTNRPMSQINFIEFIVAPLYAPVVKIFPELIALEENLVANRKAFGEQFDAETLEHPLHSGKTETQLAEEKKMVRNRYDRFLDKHKFTHLAMENIDNVAPME
ncbi:hypothetical protein CYMTET_4844 [Cymbomonas tetramitiformis]|uniref:Phosphodiesterase n=1 Tax=Cymbomonas tetramitiformis TaxID=36881 RepID=A0AAE0H0D0_9CHLO|nr:hypothetical protein CYMTET_4844 [Cymbomonas tetramitiformis]